MSGIFVLLAGFPVSLSSLGRVSDPAQNVPTVPRPVSPRLQVHY